MRLALIIVLLLLIFGLPAGGWYAGTRYHSWGYGGGGLLLVILILVLIFG
jgi:hypothetical protein